ncbi:hypothetical protein GCM10023205_18270 [Yinghuangia aomiensis]|uniref:Uncharacterized protein n=1 Tax=Yinghuangia aomiensis TaxID=676205 RepID=A0ABP9GXU2_9ACTN
MNDRNPRVTAARVVVQEKALREGFRSILGREVAVDFAGERLGAESAQDITSGMLRVAQYFRRSNIQSVTACDFSEHPRLSRNPNRTATTTPDGHVFFNLSRMGAQVREQQLGARHRMVSEGTAPFRLPHLVGFDVAAGHEYVHTAQRASVFADDPLIYNDILIGVIRARAGHSSDEHVRQEISDHYGSYPLSGKRELGAVLVTDTIWNPAEPHRFSGIVTGEQLFANGSQLTPDALRPTPLAAPRPTLAVRTLRHEPAMPSAFAPPQGLAPVRKLEIKAALPRAAADTNHRPLGPSAGPSIRQVKGIARKMSHGLGER